MDYSNIKNLPTWNNSGAGIAAQVYVAPVTWFATNGIKAPVGPFTVLGDQVQIKTAHEFITGKGFLKIACAQQKNKLDVNVTGDPGFVKQTQEANVFFPGNTPELHETYQGLLNVPCIVLVKDSSCAADLYMQLGCDCEGAFLGGPWNSGTTKDAAKGFNATFSYDGPVVFYKVDGGPALLPDVAS